MARDSLADALRDLPPLHKALVALALAAIGVAVIAHSIATGSALPGGIITQILTLIALLYGAKRAHDHRKGGT